MNQNTVRSILALATLLLASACGGDATGNAADGTSSATDTATTTEAETTDTTSTQSGTVTDAAASCEGTATSIDGVVYCIPEGATVAGTTVTLADGSTAPLNTIPHLFLSSHGVTYWVTG